MMREIRKLNEEVLKPELLELVYERTATKVKEQFAHVPEELRLKKLELHRAETRVHNFIEFIASGRATTALADALAHAEEQAKSLKADVASMAAAKDPQERGSKLGSKSSTSSWAPGPRHQRLRSAA